MSPVLLDLPTEVITLIAEFLSPIEHDALYKSCKHFVNIYELVRSLLLTPKTFQAFSNYKNIRKLVLKNTVLDYYPKKTNIKSLTIDFDQAYKRRYCGSMDFNPLFRWLLSLDLVELSSNINIYKYYLPMILTKPTLRRIYYEFLASGAIQYLNAEIEELSIIIVSSNQFIDFSSFKCLKKIYIWGVMTAIIKKSLLSIPNVEEINITLLGIDTEVNLNNIPIGKLDLSGYRGYLEPFTCIKKISKIVFPSQVKIGDLKLFEKDKKLRCRVASFEAIDYGIIDRSDIYYQTDELLLQYQ